MARPGITVIVSSSATVGPPGPQGPQGIQGIQGPQGEGVPSGGVADQIIVKQSATDYDTAWDYIQTLTENVKNVTTGTLAKGTPVHVTGSTGNTVEVIAADAATNYPAHFILNEDLDAEAEGRGIAIGFINNVDVPDASIYTEGQTVYLGASGGWVTTKPTGTNAIQNLGIIVKVNTSTNKISGVVLGAGRANDVPNLPDGYFFIGSATNTTTSAYTLPTTDGTDKQVLQTNGQGAVTFSSLSEIGQFVFDTTQAVGAGTNDYVLTYDNSDQKIRLEPNDTGGIASITGAAPISVTTGATPTVSISPASTSADGFMSQSDKVKLNGIETSADVTDIANVNDAIDHMDSFHLSPQSPRPSDWILIKQDGGDLEYVEFNEVSKVNSLNLTSAGDYGLGSQIWYYGNTSTNAGRIYYLNTSGTWTIASASAPNTGGTSLLAVAAGSNSSTDGMILNGFVYMNGGVSGNIGMPVYLTTGTNQSGGLPVNTAPSSVGEVVRVVGNKIDANILFFNPDQHFEIV